MPCYRRTKDLYNAVREAIWRDTLGRAGAWVSAVGEPTPGPAVCYAVKDETQPRPPGGCSRTSSSNRQSRQPTSARGHRPAFTWLERRVQTVTRTEVRYADCRLRDLGWTREGYGFGRRVPEGYNWHGVAGWTGLGGVFAGRARARLFGQAKRGCELNYGILMSPYGRGQELPHR